MTDAAANGPELRLAYRKQLAEVEERVLVLGATVIECIPRGTEVLLTSDLSAVQQLIDDDDEIDHLTVTLEELCYSIMVRQAPMAGELRQLIASAQISGELERVADLMVNIVKGSRRLYGATITPKVRGLAASMAEECQRMLGLAITAYRDRDDNLGSALGDIDDRLDELNREMIEAVFEGHEAGEIDLQAAVQLALVSRYYERIGDHAVNIGQRVTYMATGWLPEHRGALRAEQAGTVRNAQTRLADL